MDIFFGDRQTMHDVVQGIDDRKKYFNSTSHPGGKQEEYERRRGLFFCSRAKSLTVKKNRAFKRRQRLRCLVKVGRLKSLGKRQTALFPYLNISTFGVCLAHKLKKLPSRIKWRVTYPYFFSTISNSLLLLFSYFFIKVE